jgi:hypothetical protein
VCVPQGYFSIGQKIEQLDWPEKAGVTVRKGKRLGSSPANPFERPNSDLRCGLYKKRSNNEALTGYMRCYVERK